MKGDLDILMKRRRRCNCIRDEFAFIQYKISHYEKGQNNEDFPERKEGFMKYNELFKNKGYDEVDYKI
jgi:hypothetical protein